MSNSSTELQRDIDLLIKKLKEARGLNANSDLTKKDKKKIVDSLFDDHATQVEKYCKLIKDNHQIRLLLSTIVAGCVALAAPPIAGVVFIHALPTVFLGSWLALKTKFDPNKRIREAVEKQISTPQRSTVTPAGHPPAAATNSITTQQQPSPNPGHGAGSNVNSRWKAALGSLNPGQASKRAAAWVRRRFGGAPPTP